VLTRQKIANEQQNAAENILFDSYVHPPCPFRATLPLAFIPATNSTLLKQPAGCFITILSSSARFGQPFAIVTAGVVPAAI
jgi:hypothetical protein